jgi:hypothetical protein
MAREESFEMIDVNGSYNLEKIRPVCDCGESGSVIPL